MYLPIEKFIFVCISKKEAKLKDSDEYNCLGGKAEHRKEKVYKNHSNRKDDTQFCEFILHRFVFWVEEVGNDE